MSRGMLSTGFVEFMSPAFIRKWHKGLHKGTTKVEDLPTVQCVQMKKIMREINVKHVDIWILGKWRHERECLQVHPAARIIFLLTNHLWHAFNMNCCC